MFSLHFIREGIFHPKDAHVFSRIMKYREETDCKPACSFIADDFAEFERKPRPYRRRSGNILVYRAC
jgi:hypothetical protein